MKKLIFCFLTLALISCSSGGDSPEPTPTPIPIEDSFISKFGKYILVECKNMPITKVNKNDFIVFQNKSKNTNGLAELGIIATTGFITRNTYIEAIRESAESRKILFLSNPEIEKLIKADNKLSTFKNLIDNQVKDN